jgi:hypothetical protein
MSAVRDFGIGRDVGCLAACAGNLTVIPLAFARLPPMLF